ncbi:MnhB domain-containing protein [Methanosphaera cuniculi]|uniref:Cation:proton antiporter n=1 Tax=Methanosphaera cuniculi TaxID=1077256 RepID=A0A2A2HFK0_9EURY|nr:MnhB domain-containing protein [Methanosphaera cuniculi]PAV08219.1 cation:proton antiporter [Methanosphaera cuniculi]PWL08306.1 putative monovalent cation/H+ antiporter subunit B [Methanosphaera cuniculi]
MSDLLKLIGYPVSFIMIGYGAMTILGGHITPGGGFQGGTMMASGAILCILTYGLKDNPFNLSHERMSIIESCGALLYVILGLCGLFLGGSFLYNVGTNIYGLIPSATAGIFNYPDALHAGIIPYLNIVVGLKVFIGLTTLVILFYGVTKYREDYVDDEEID